MATVGMEAMWVIGGIQNVDVMVKGSGTGSGTVTSSPSGINCGPICSVSTGSASFTLTASPAAGSVFAGWSSNCISNNQDGSSCTVTMNAAKSVIATFNVSQGGGAGTSLPPLLTPYVSEFDMVSINALFNSRSDSNSPWRMNQTTAWIHDGLDIFPKGNLSPFQAACSGKISIALATDDSAHVMLICNST